VPNAPSLFNSQSGMLSATLPGPSIYPYVQGWKGSSSPSLHGLLPCGGQLDPHRHRPAVVPLGPPLLVRL
jgi:hypothetical protein